MIQVTAFLKAKSFELWRLPWDFRRRSKLSFRAKQAEKQARCLQLAQLGTFLSVPGNSGQRRSVSKPPARSFPVVSAAFLALAALTFPAKTYAQAPPGP